MQASSSSDKSEIPKQTMATILGTAIALITLTLPMVTVAYFSPQDNLNNTPNNNYPPPTLKK
jgi:amino acid transporter